MQVNGVHARQLCAEFHVSDRPNLICDKGCWCLPPHSLDFKRTLKSQHALVTLLMVFSPKCAFNAAIPPVGLFPVSQIHISASNFAASSHCSNGVGCYPLGNCCPVGSHVASSTARSCFGQHHMMMSNDMKWTPQQWKPWTVSKLCVPSSRIVLNDGNRMPILGLGAAMAPQSARAAVRSSLELGYRLVDTAQGYMNEYEVGTGAREFLQDSGNLRENIFISSKLDPYARNFKAAVEAGKASCDALGLDYIDLMLVHTPHGGKLVEVYDALLELQAQGFVKSIGVSNFDNQHLDALEYYDRPAPAVNQIEMHPLIHAERTELLERCRSSGIQVQAACPLLAGASEFLHHGTIADISAKIGRSPAQILLRWALQQGFVVIPKSVDPERQAENSKVFDFELRSEELAALQDVRGLMGRQKLVLYPEAFSARVDIGRTTSRLSNERG